MDAAVSEREHTAALSVVEVEGGSGGEATVSRDGVPGTWGSWASSFWTLGSYLKNGNNSTFYLFVCLLYIYINRKIIK